MTLPVAVLASGSGSNLQALIEAEAEGLAYRVELLITDRECGAEARARNLGRDVVRIPFAGRDPDDVGRDVLDALRAAGTSAILLAGFLRLIPSAVVQAFPRRILNVHPALLPSFGGKGMYGIRVHEAVLAAGAKLSGPTVHYVDERYDEGGIVAQWPVPVWPGDSAATLAERVLAVEHRLFPAAADALAKAVLNDGSVRFQWPVQSETTVVPSLQSIRKAFENSS
ncbi:MAG: phosphoribosylglycinamide formyltransferase [Longimicrobiales bacterium]